jgi:hypothetical protein
VPDRFPAHKKGALVMGGEGPTARTHNTYHKGVYTMESWKSSSARILMVGCVAVFCLGSSWTWDEDIDNSWTECRNWQASACSGLPGYPSTSNDDLNFPYGGIVNIITETVDDMVIESTLGLGGSPGAVLTVDSIFMDGTNDDVLLGVGNGVTLIASGDSEA